MNIAVSARAEGLPLLPLSGSDQEWLEWLEWTFECTMGWGARGRASGFRLRLTTRAFSL